MTADVAETITAQVVRSALAVAAEEASVVVVRSSHSTNIQEGADAAGAVLDATGRLVAQSAATTVMHSASLRCGLGSLLEEIPIGSMRPGDVYALNDPYRGGIHANDIMVLRPVFAEDRVRWFGGTLVHVADLGGSAVGGLGSLATDTYAEGVLLPPVRLYEEGRPSAGVLGIIARNSRTPAKVIGDVQALVAGGNVVARRLEELAERYGISELEGHVEDYIDYTQARFQEELRRIPSGAYRGSFTIDSDGVTEGRTFDVVTTVTVADGSVVVDFTGTSPQSAGAINASTSQTLSGVVYALRCFVDPSVPMNEGCFRSIRTLLPSGSLVNPTPPAACGGRVVTVTAATEAILQALSQAAPDHAVAASALIHVYTLTGLGDDHERWLTLGYEFGGIGARAGADGPDATGAYFLGGRSVIPQIEPLEAQYPFVVERCRLVPDTGGPGIWRGGLGVEMALRMTGRAELTVRGDRMELPPPGAKGGAAGAAGFFAVVRADGSDVPLRPKQQRVPLGVGDVFVMRTSGGGGLGDPRKRDRRRVAQDVHEGRVTPEGAVTAYGAVLEESDQPPPAPDTERPATPSSPSASWEQRGQRPPVAHSEEGRCFLGVDVGGTFTDVVLADAGGNVASLKVPTTPDDPRQGVAAGVSAILRTQKVAPHRVTRFVHGTTLAANVILEHKGSDVAFVTTEGFGDMLRLGRESRLQDERFDLFFRTPAAPVRPELTFEVRERVDASGKVLVDPEPSQLRQVAARVAASGARGVAICLLNSYAAPGNEQMVAEACRAAMAPEAFVVASSDVWPEMREYERAMTTVMCAYVGPVMGRYLAGLGDQLAAIGVGCPIEVMESGGGVMSGALASRRPVFTIESGAAAGAVAAGFVGGLIGNEEVLSFDMGGTTAKTGVVRRGRPDVRHDCHVGGAQIGADRRAGSGYPVKVPVVDLAEVGAGGGSIAWVDSGGALQVGPESSGSVPGPACYGRGGGAATVTDANLLLGYLRPGELNAGVSLSEEPAARAIRQHVAAPLGLSVPAAARAIHDVANAKMAAAVRVVTVQRGIDPGTFTLVSFGGAGPMHAAELAGMFGMSEVVVPHRAGVASALGLVVSDLVVDEARTCVMASTAVSPAEVAAVYRELERRAADKLPLGGGEMTVTRSVDVRYRGQAHQLTVPAPVGPMTAASIEQVARSFGSLYRDTYGIDVDAPTELVNFRVRVVRQVEKLSLIARVGATGDAEQALIGHRAAWLDGSHGFVDCPVYEWEKLEPGSPLSGPAVVEGPDTTVVIPSTATVQVDPWENLVLRRRAAPAGADSGDSRLDR